MKTVILIVAIALTSGFNHQAYASEHYNDWGAWATTTPPVALSSATAPQSK